MFKRVMRHVVRKESPFFRAGMDADSLYLEGVYIQHRNLDPEHLETEGERKDRLITLLASGAAINPDDANFLLNPCPLIMPKLRMGRNGSDKHGALNIQPHFPHLSINTSSTRSYTPPPPLKSARYSA